MPYFAIYDPATLEWVGISGRSPDPSTVELEEGLEMIVQEERFSPRTHKPTADGGLEAKKMFLLRGRSTVKIGQRTVISNVPEGSIVGFHDVPKGETIEGGKFGFSAEDPGRYNLYFHHPDYVTVIFPVEVVDE